MYCGIPFTSRTKLEGHAVRAMYACCGATDYYLETGDETYWKTLTTLWNDLSQRQMYITGRRWARAATANLLAMRMSCRIRRLMAKAARRSEI